MATQSANKGGMHMLFGALPGSVAAHHEQVGRIVRTTSELPSVRTQAKPRIPYTGRVPPCEASMKTTTPTTHPDKLLVRVHLSQRRADKAPPPTPDRIREQLGWHLIPANEAGPSGTDAADAVVAVTDSEPA